MMRIQQRQNPITVCSELALVDLQSETSYIRINPRWMVSCWSRPEHGLCHIKRIPDRAASMHKKSIVPCILI